MRTASSTWSSAPDLATNPDAPAVAARLISSASSDAVSITTRTLGYRSTSVAASVTPSTSGSAKSSSTTSGLVRSTSRWPSAAVVAVPTTSMSSSFAMAKVSRSSSVWWSSMRATVVVLPMSPPAIDCGLSHSP